MRYVAAGLVLGVAGLASADPLPESAFDWRKPNDSGTFVEVGGGLMHAARDGVIYSADYARFAPQVAVHRWFYVGAAFEVGHVYGSSGKLDGMLPPVCSKGKSGAECIPGSNEIDETSGTIVEPQVFIGAREQVGSFSGGVELAPTVRWTTASTDELNNSFTTTQTLLELHARADVWITPHINAGVMVGADTSSRHDLMAGLQVGVHFEAYDAMRR